MKKITKSGLLLLLVILVGGVVYYLSIVYSGGTAKIKFIEPEDDYKTFSDIINHPDLRGKVLYVDYWHTGCGPCIEEFKHLPALKEKFQDHQDLVFLYLGKDRSVPGEKFRWKRMIEKKNLSGYHYFMSNQQYDALWLETVNDSTILQAFPHNLIVDRSGRIINNNAPKPSNKLLESTLLEALKN